MDQIWIFFLQFLMFNLLFQGIEMVFNRYFILVIQSEVDTQRDKNDTFTSFSHNT